jgi:hypothetical protein
MIFFFVTGHYLTGTFLYRSGTAASACNTEFADLTSFPLHADMPPCHSSSGFRGERARHDSGHH